MNKYVVGGTCLIIIGIIMLAISAIVGEGSAGIVLIFPVFIGTGIYSVIGVLCILAGFVLLFFGFAIRFTAPEEAFEHYYEPPKHVPEEPTSKRVEGGGVVLIGPFPIIFGTSTKLVFWLVILTIILIVVMCLLLTFMSRFIL
jgi:uncharacterized protein (TIGR00304 family)